MASSDAIVKYPSSNRTFTYPDKDGIIAMLDDICTTLTLASDSTVSTTTNADVSGMSFTALANTDYEIEVLGSFQTAATTTGIGISLNIPSGSVNGFVIAPSANTTPMISIQRSEVAASNSIIMAGTIMKYRVI